VIIPPTIAEAAASNDDLSTLVTAVGAASSELQETLVGPGPLTVFAPLNQAFAAIPAADLNALLANQQALDDVLGYHVTTGQTLSTELSDGQTITMSNGDTLTIDIEGEEVRLIDALGNMVRVVMADIRLLNGVVHLIDGVLLPFSLAP
jgi:uncharacterized surface protein with fasciclin (FAS1) repeats